MASVKYQLLCQNYTNYKKAFHAFGIAHILVSWMPDGRRMVV